MDNLERKLYKPFCYSPVIYSQPENMRLVLWCDICKENHEIILSKKGSNQVEVGGKLCLSEDELGNIPESVRKKLGSLIMDSVGLLRTIPAFLDFQYDWGNSESVIGYKTADYKKTARYEW